jgi:hypothetical protein
MWLEFNVCSSDLGVKFERYTGQKSKGLLDMLLQYSFRLMLDGWIYHCYLSRDIRERILSAALAGDRYLAGRISPTDAAADSAWPLWCLTMCWTPYWLQSACLFCFWTCKFEALISELWWPRTLMYSSATLSSSVPKASWLEVRSNSVVLLGQRTHGNVRCPIFKMLP